MPFENLPLDRVRPAEGQPRKTFYQDSLEELAASIRERGVLEPIVVRPAGKPGCYEIVMGERRWRACQLAGLDTIPAIVRDLSDDEAALDSLLENFQREDLNPVEKAYAIRGLLQVFTVEKTARALGVSETTIRRALDLLELPAGIQAELIVRPGAGQPTFNETHARALLAFQGDAGIQARLVVKVKSERLSVLSLEKLIEAIQKYPAKREIFLHVPVGVTEQMVRSLEAREERSRPYKPQVARDHLKGIDRQVSGLADLLDVRVVEHLTAEEMNHLLASMTLIQKQIEQFAGQVRQALERQDFSFREVYIHCPLCGRIELVGAVRCSVCWTILRRCIDCGHYDDENALCRSRAVGVARDDAEAPGEDALSYRCESYLPRFVPKGVALPVHGSGRDEAPRTGMMRKF